MANTIRKSLLILALLFGAFLCGCQTVQGIGRDITWAGAACEDTLDKVVYGSPEGP